MESPHTLKLQHLSQQLLLLHLLAGKYGAAALGAGEGATPRAAACLTTSYAGFAAAPKAVRSPRGLYPSPPPDTCSRPCLQRQQHQQGGQSGVRCLGWPRVCFSRSPACLGAAWVRATPRCDHCGARPCGLATCCASWLSSQVCPLLPPPPPHRCTGSTRPRGRRRGRVVIFLQRSS